VEPKPDSYRSPWRTAHGDLIDEEWELIADLVPTYSGKRRIGRPCTTHATSSTRSSPSQPQAVSKARSRRATHSGTVHRSHPWWSRDGTWERIALALGGESDAPQHLVIASGVEPPAQGRAPGPLDFRTVPSNPVASEEPPAQSGGSAPIGCPTPRVGPGRLHSASPRPTRR